MIIQYASDLHLEFPQNLEFLRLNPLQPMGDILLLAGDIVPFARMDMHSDFFSYVSDNFQTVYWVPGNHEYYYFDIATKSGVLNEKIRSNVFLVNNIAVQHEAVNFIFSTMWSKISHEYAWQIERGISDFHVIKFNGNRFSSVQFNKLHLESMTFLRQELQKKHTQKTVVVTHHVPTFLNYSEKFKGSPLNDAFTVELYDLIESEGPDFWIYGHTHYNAPDFMIGKTQLLTNQLGYVSHNEHKYFRTDLINNLNIVAD